MAGYTQELQLFPFGGLNIKLWVPDLQGFRTCPRKQESGQNTVPYWAKLWPSAVAMCRFLAAHPALITGKEVLELAAGLGLPGIAAAHLAAHVTISDYMPGAVAAMQSSAALNGLTNITCCRLDWQTLPPGLTADVLLLSDINYDPAAFDVLYGVLLRFLDQGTTIVLATPQRLMAKPFIERLLPFCIRQDEQSVTLPEEHAYISMLVLRR